MQVARTWHARDMRVACTRYTLGAALAWRGGGFCFSLGLRSELTLLFVREVLLSFFFVSLFFLFVLV